MKKTIIIIVAIVAVVLIGVFWSFSIQNNAVVKDENVTEAWANVETSYQRRNDLIGNLVKTVQGAADFERKTLTDVIEARAKATSVNIDASNITPESIQQFQQAQSGVSSALSRLLVSVERYPELKANQNFLKLQDELTSTENTIMTARTRYNAAVKDFNIYIQKMPNKFFLSGYEKKPSYKADEGADKAKEVEFNF
ncbi:LemA family protein [Neptunitalea lumnitzerae]|uniref:LemA family protein n=1 Tax=Neptunitalea lumnitzerae TaxID=2965509 RepID=A0ABQ5ME72_9FLAO|nr:LemA family protein [Neptunitalea sp. Y10]GLB47674.1 LemA family protein [Neptunitalea sp. Y10]